MSWSLSRSRCRRAASGRRPTSVTSAPASRSSSAEQLAGDVGARQQEALALQRPRCARAPRRTRLRRGTRPASDRRGCRSACSRAAVDGPTVQSRTPFRSRTSPAASSCAMKWSTRVGAREDDPVERRRRAPHAAIERGRDPRAARSGSSAPGSPRRRAPRACSTSSPACSRDRVTTMRRPKSGRSSNQRRCSRSPTTAPMTSSAGARSSTRVGDRAERAVDRSAATGASRRRSAPRIRPPAGRARGAPW